MPVVRTRLPGAAARLAVPLLLGLACPLAAQAPEDAAKAPEVARLKNVEPLLAVRYSPDGKWLVGSGQNQSVRLWDVTNRTERAAMKDAVGGWCLACSPCGKFVAACGTDRYIRLWDVANGTLVKQFDGHQQVAWTVAFLPDGQRLVSVGEDSVIRYWSVSTGKEIGQLEGHPGPIWCMALSFDGTTMATGGADGAVRVWDLVARRLLRVCDERHQGGVWPMVFAPDGRTVASAGWQDQTIRVWEVSTGRLRRQYVHSGGVKFVAFAPDGRTLATAGNDQAVRLWSLTDGKALRPLEGHLGQVNSVAFSPDGRVLASASSDATLRLWDVSGLLADAPAPRTLTDRELDALWAALADEDGGRAYDALWALSASSQQAAALLRQRLQPAAPPDLGRIHRLIAEIDSDRYVIRQRASLELERMGEVVQANLTSTLRNPPSLEAKRRVERLLQKLENNGLSSEQLRGVRSVELLERMGGPEARHLLGALSQGAADTRLTLEARAALQRLSAQR